MSDTRLDILVLGALHLDVVVNASGLPRIDETLVGEDVNYVCGGKGGNQAVAAARHGARVGMLGRVGNDDFGRRILANLVDAGVDCSSVSHSTDRPSGMSVAIVNAQGEYGAVIVSAANRELVPDSIELSERVEVGFLLLQNEIPAETNLAAARQAKRMGAKVVLNAAPWRTLDDALLQCIDLLIVNRIEAAMATSRSIDTAEDAATAALELSNRQRETIVTLGAGGMVYCNADGTTEYHESFTVDVVSSHGAGDVFVGALLAHLTQTGNMSNALRYASAASALHVSTPVTARHTVVKAKVREWLSDLKERIVL